MGPFEQITVDVDDAGVATITLNRPERMNAWTAQMGDELSEANEALDHDDAVRAIVYTGAGRAFCAGADLGAGGSTFDNSTRTDEPPSERRRRALLVPWQLRKPTIAAINGHAVGVGITYPLQCDVRFVAEDAKIQFAFVRRGVMPELASHVIAARVLGLSNAADLLLSGRMVSGTEAAALGLASKALPRDQVLPAAQAWARDLAINAAPVSVAVAKRLLWDGLTDSVAAMLAKEGGIFDQLGRSADSHEGVTAFLERREPKWTGSVSRDFPSMP